MELKDNFEQAVSDSKQLPAKPDNDTLLKLYSLYKQATEGDINIDPPGMFDFVAKAKYDAWTKLKGVGADVAMQQYVDLVEGLKG
jgi:diazepam-binding inhibitor (GABA receptor modulating acyl-CoA-binding protein)